MTPPRQLPVDQIGVCACLAERYVRHRARPSLIYDLLGEQPALVQSLWHRIHNEPLPRGRRLENALKACASHKTRIEGSVFLFAYLSRAGLHRADRLIDAWESLLLAIPAPRIDINLAQLLVDALQIERTVELRQCGCCGLTFLDHVEFVPSAKRCPWCAITGHKPGAGQAPVAIPAQAPVQEELPL